MSRLGGKQSLEITVVGLRWLERVELLLFLVVVAQCLAELMKRIDALPRSDQRPFPGDFVHERVDVFKLLECRPADVARPPVRARPQQHRKSLGKILVRMALRIPEPKVLDIAPAGRIGPVVARVALRGRPEQLLPAPATLQLVGMLYGMARLMTENGHALGPGAALDVEHHFLLDLHQAGMSEIERDRNTRRAFRTEPLARYPRVRPQPDAPLLEFFIKIIEAILEPGAFDRNPQTAETALD